MKVSFLNGQIKTTKKGLFQYDFGQFLEVYGVDYIDKYVEFQFIQNEKQIDQLGEFDENDKFYKVRIPDEFLMNTDELLCYLYYETETTGKTERIIELEIQERDMFEDIPDEEKISLLGEVLEKLNEIDEEIKNISLNDEQLEYIVNEVNKNIELDNYYTKDEVDNIKQNVWYPEVDDAGNLSWSKSLTDEAPVIVNIKGEQGEKGEKGDKGDQGERGEDGKDGQDGQNGKDGENGKDGQDYVLTEEDKTEIENNLKVYVDTYILGGEF